MMKLSKRLSKGSSPVSSPRRGERPSVGGAIDSRNPRYQKKAAASTSVGGSKTPACPGSKTPIGSQTPVGSKTPAASRSTRRRRRRREQHYDEEDADYSVAETGNFAEDGRRDARHHVLGGAPPRARRGRGGHGQGRGGKGRSHASSKRAPRRKRASEICSRSMPSSPSKVKIAMSDMPTAIETPEIQFDGYNMNIVTELENTTLPKQRDRDSLYKTELCMEWNRNSYCYYGKRCSFAHGIKELRPVLRSKKWRTKRCRNFQSEGWCPYAHRCQFLHDQSSLPLGANEEFADAAPLSPESGEPGFMSPPGLGPHKHTSTRSSPGGVRSPSKWAMRGGSPHASGRRSAPLLSRSISPAKGLPIASILAAVRDISDNSGSEDSMSSVGVETPEPGTESEEHLHSSAKRKRRRKKKMQAAAEAMQSPVFGTPSAGARWTAPTAAGGEYSAEDYMATPSKGIHYPLNFTSPQHSTPGIVSPVTGGTGVATAGDSPAKAHMFSAPPIPTWDSVVPHDLRQMNSFLGGGRGMGNGMPISSPPMAGMGMPAMVGSPPMAGMPMAGSPPLVGMPMAGSPHMTGMPMAGSPPMTGMPMAGSPPLSATPAMDPTTQYWHAWQEAMRGAALASGQYPPSGPPQHGVDPLAAQMILATMSGMLMPGAYNPHYADYAMQQQQQQQQQTLAALMTAAAMQSQGGPSPMEAGAATQTPDLQRLLETLLANCVQNAGGVRAPAMAQPLAGAMSPAAAASMQGLTHTMSGAGVGKLPTAEVSTASIGTSMQPMPSLKPTAMTTTATTATPVTAAMTAAAAKKRSMKIKGHETGSLTSRASSPRNMGMTAFAFPNQMGTAAPLTITEPMPVLGQSKDAPKNLFGTFNVGQPSNPIPDQLGFTMSPQFAGVYTESDACSSVGSDIGLGMAGRMPSPPIMGDMFGFPAFSLPAAAPHFDAFSASLPAMLDPALAATLPSPCTSEMSPLPYGMAMSPSSMTGFDCIEGSLSPCSLPSLPNAHMAIPTLHIAPVPVTTSATLVPTMSGALMAAPPTVVPMTAPLTAVCLPKHAQY